ncbi:WG repeat-containing protein [Butyrivibrio sp. X503]|uniref:WG repeat-containing protein n=1 Tax=Butyrivibrio sp. X503 TaxID=2364878 RepID=UPI000EA942C4|nr:WG repeat-containing protein [Butyrivibrio sp. X503]RKM55112.1 WG repeat-containing protein [Butyrivibrio sp. X503]
MSIKTKKIIVILAFIFIAAFLAGDLAFVSRSNVAEGYYYIDENFNIINKAPVDTLPGKFSKEGYAIGDGGVDIWIMDKEGKFVKRPDDDTTATNFEEDGLFKTCKGYYDKDFNLVIEIKYSDNYSPCKNIIDSNPRAFSSNELAAVPVYRKMDNDHAAVEVWGYINKNGEFMIEPQYKSAEDFGKNGYALVENMDGTFVFIDENGNEVSKKYSNAYPFSDNGLAIVCESDSKRAGYVNDDFEFVIENDGYVKHPFSDNNLAAVSKKVDKAFIWGFINEKGEQVIDFQFGAVPYGFVNGYCVVCKGGKWGFIDETGNYIFEKKFSRQPNSFSEDGIALIQDDNGLYGYIKTDGTWLLEPQFEKATDYSNGYAGVWLNENQKIKTQ